MALNKDSQDRLNAIKEEESLQRRLEKILNERVSKSGNLTTSQIDLMELLKDEIDIEDKLLTIQEQKDVIFKTYMGRNKELGRKLIEQLEAAEDLLKTEIKRKNKTAEIKQLYEDTADSLLYSVGLSKEMFKNGVSFGLGMLVAKKGAETLTAAFESTVGQAEEMYKTFGTTVGESARVGMEVGKASFSMTGLIYGSEAVAESSSDIANYFNSTAAITSDTLKNVTELSSLMGDGAGAARMNAILKSANENAIDLKDDIKDIANNSGINAAAVFKEMDAQAGKLLGKSEKELKTNGCNGKTWSY